MSTKTYDWVYTLSPNGGSTYTVTPMAAFYPTKMLRDDADGNADGIVADSDPLSLYLSPLTFGVTLFGLEAGGGVAVDSGSTLYYLSNENLSPGEVITLTDGTMTFCFAEGTQIATPKGEQAVETLSIGDVVTNAAGNAVAVKWIGRQSVPTHFNRVDVRPVRIRAGALGHGLPHSDLVVTPDHGMICNGHVVDAAALVNGTTITYVPQTALKDVETYYHVETEDHDAIFANGAATETFVDATGRAAFDNYQEYLDLYGAERIIPQMSAPRICASRLLPKTFPAARAAPKQSLQVLLDWAA